MTTIQATFFAIFFMAAVTGFTLFLIEKGCFKKFDEFRKKYIKFVD